MPQPGPSELSYAVLKQRLGHAGLGASRYVRAVADLAAGERLEAVIIAMWRRRGWAVVATDAGLRLARRPRLFGRARHEAFAWEELTAVHSGTERVTMMFGDTEVDLLGGPHGELVRLIEAARTRLHEDKPSVEELRDLARQKLGRMESFGWESTIEALPDRLEPGELVQRLAIATLDFTGLLVLTDRRLLLLDIALRRSNDRTWETDRAAIRGVESVDFGLRLELADGETILRNLHPLDRRDEFAAVLAARLL